jgi:GAF domain
MSDTHGTQHANQSHKPSDKYFSFQIKGWANFDPMDKTLATVAEGINQGNGVLTLVEVLSVQDDVASIPDEEARDCFEELSAAKRLIRNFNELPTKLKEDLRAALRTEEEIAPRKMVTLMPDSSGGPEPAAVVKRDPAVGSSSPATAVEIVLSDATIAEIAGNESRNREAFAAKSDASDRPSGVKPIQSDFPKEGFFPDTGEALFAIVEMRRQIREQGLDLEATVDLVIGRAQEITQCYGIAVGFLPQEIGFQSRTGSHGKDLAFDANLFQSRLVAGEAVQITDAEKHPLMGATYRREGVGSLIMVPIFRNREVAGAIEFFFQEKRSFSAGDVMDLGLIAGVISESIGGSRNVGVKLANVPQLGTDPTPTSDLLEAFLKEDGYSPTPPTEVADAIDAKTPLAECFVPESIGPAPAPKKPPATPSHLWRNLKRAWARPRPSRGL